MNTMRAEDVRLVRQRPRELHDLLKALRGRLYGTPTDLSEWPEAESLAREIGQLWDRAHATACPACRAQREQEAAR